MSVGSLCIREVVAVSRDATVTATAELMRSQHVGSVVVMEKIGDRQMPVGMLTDRDIVVEVVATGLDPRTITAGDIMTPSPVTVEEEEDVSDVVQMMCLRGVRRVPVMTAGGTLVGVLSVNDLLAKYAEDISGLSHLSARQRRRESKERR